MRTYLIFFIIMLTLVAGCVSPEIPEGDPQDYELPGLYNTTVFYLNTSSVQVVESVSNATELRFEMGNTGDLDVRNPVAVDYSGNNVSFNVSKEVVFGKSYIRFDFDSPLTGFVAFTQQNGQDFSRPLIKNGTVMVLLPKNYTTGSRFLGIANPKPDNITIDSSGREVLTWDKPYPEHKVISVKYYKKSAPVVLGYFFTLLVIIGLVLFGYYYRTIHGLKKKRDIMEKDIRNK